MDYINKNTLFVKLGIWSVLFVFGFTMAFCCFGAATSGGGFAVSAWLCFMGILNVMLVVYYIRTLMFLGMFIRMNNLLVNDEDGLIPVKEICDYLHMDRKKFEKARLYGIRKKIFINMVYDDANDRFILSDRYKPGEKTTAKPFIGMSCPGCAAALKIRSGATCQCPVCGREVTAPSIIVEE